ncbi:Uncharacterised protein [Klebsiella pneumoniae]|nr:Uncharacterised protein [Klebsiella pneumoniae]
MVIQTGTAAPHQYITVLKRKGFQGMMPLTAAELKLHRQTE